MNELDNLEIKCNDCVHKLSSPSSHHISCNFFKEDGLKQSMSMYVLLVKKLPFILKLTNKLNNEVVEVDPIIFDKHGIEQGWCNWPFDFDPIWVKCIMGKKNDN
jgi:hypothetical protein